mmetsp:Transcript_50783/g.128036  ORF Transcript_50783/g.128036 Transcript_50783/m.128036 type:complete len:257 (-) Transcript_50783:74-844(-)
MNQVAQILDRWGLMECVPEMGPQVLRLTLVSAANIKHRSNNFYFEAWAEPSEGYPKNSRVHRPTSGTVDLGCEHLEIDWVGDEKEVVLHAVEYSGKKQSVDLPIGEVRIPRQAIERYMLEARKQPNDMRYGTRTLDLTAVQRQEAIQRRRRFQDMFLPHSWFAAILAKVGAETGVHVPTPEEVAKLRNENEALKFENAKLRQFTSGRSDDGCIGGCGPCDRPERAMCVAVRFELVEKNSSDLGRAALIRQASFQER